MTDIKQTHTTPQKTPPKSKAKAPDKVITSTEGGSDHEVKLAIYAALIASGVVAERRLEAMTKQFMEHYKTL